jgi:hypothetical protein
MGTKRYVEYSLVRERIPNGVEPGAEEITA